MSALSPKDITQLLVDWSDGNKEALDKLVPLVHEELRRLARRYMRREHAGHTLQTSALVNEAYLKLIDQREVRWRNRTHFFAIAAQLMRRILIDHARRHHYQKRGGGAYKLSLDEAALVIQERAADLVALDDALSELAEFDPRKSRIVEMRFFGGMSAEEVAEALSCSLRTVEREWRKAKAWLHRAVSRGAINEA
jgi:RNA polymerase sigma factor (TIGR02999 family)